MERPVEQGRPDVHDRIAGEHAALHLLPMPLSHCRDVLLRDHAADDLVDELVVGIARLRRWPDLQLDVPVLAPAAGLAHELAFPLGRLRMVSR